MTCIEAHPDQSRWSPVTLDANNRLPVRAGDDGVALVGRQQLQLPSGVDTVTRPGELVFASDSACLLLGPWGPDPRRHLMLRARLTRICTGDDQLWLELEVEKGLPLVQLSLSRYRYEKLPLSNGQRLWLSIPAGALQFIPAH